MIEVRVPSLQDAEAGENTVFDRGGPETGHEFADRFLFGGIFPPATGLLGPPFLFCG